MTLVYKNIQFATVTIYCSQLQKCISELAPRKGAGVNAPYVRDKIDIPKKAFLQYFVMNLADKIWNAVVRRS